MFDIGFWEMGLLAIITLLVVGPERLPKVAYEAGKWFSKLQRFIRSARSEIERELHNYEIKQTLDKHKKELTDVQETIKETGKEIKQGFEEVYAELQPKQQTKTDLKKPKDED